MNQIQIGTSFLVVYDEQDWLSLKASMQLDDSNKHDFPFALLFFAVQIGEEIGRIVVTLSCSNISDLYSAMNMKRLGLEGYEYTEAVNTETADQETNRGI